jgi:hypothetical protein
LGTILDLLFFCQKIIYLVDRRIKKYIVEIYRGNICKSGGIILKKLLTVLIVIFLIITGCSKNQQSEAEKELNNNKEVVVEEPTTNVEIGLYPIEDFFPSVNLIKI